MYKSIIKPILFKINPESAHHLSMSFLKIGHKLKFTNFLPNQIIKDPIEICGLKFPNRLGLAAGFDKNGEWIDELSTLGFSHIEIGTVTPKSQQGNSKPRLFRLPEQQALINRMGFNNDGLTHVKENLDKRGSKVIVGGNIGKNKTTPNEIAMEDYVRGLEELYEYVDYFTINISSPNTPGLRDLLEKDQLEILLKSVDEKRKDLEEYFSIKRPTFVKISPDMTQSQIGQLLNICCKWNIDGIVSTNTTISRDGILLQESGGLSGKHLQKKSNQIIKFIYDITSGQLPIIGVGGVFTKDDYDRKIDSGASLVQVYTGLIYEGPFIVRKILG